MTNKTFALTGGTGAIGSQFVRVLSRIKELKTIAITRRPLSFSNENIQVLIEKDLFSLGILERIIQKSDVLYHLAGVNPNKSVTKNDYPVFLAINSLFSAIVCKLAKKYDQKIVFVSSASVYELVSNRGIPEYEPLPVSNEINVWMKGANKNFSRYASTFIRGKNQTKPLEFAKNYLIQNPLPCSNIYALSKLLGESFIDETQQGLILRLSDVYGPGDESIRIIPNVMRALKSESIVKINFGQRSHIGFIYVGDVIRALLRSADVKIENLDTNKKRVVNVVSTRMVSEKNLAETLNQIFQGKKKFTATNFQKKDKENPLPLYTGRLKNVLKLKTLVNLREGLSETIRYHNFSEGAKNEYAIRL